MKTAIFIDGGYFSKVLSAEHGSPKVDYSKLAVWLNKGNSDTLLRAYYYNCLPYQSEKPSEQESRLFAGCQRFHAALRHQPKMEVREGRLEYRGQRENGEPIFVQKRVDVAMACDIALLATKKAVNRIVLVTGDSDFLPMVELAKNEGVLVALAHGTTTCKPHSELWEAADERIPLTKEAIRRVLLT